MSKPPPSGVPAPIDLNPMADGAAVHAGEFKASESTEGEPEEVMPPPVLHDADSDLGSSAEQSDAREISEALSATKKAVKRISFNRHDPTTFDSVFAPAFTLFSDMVEKHESLHLKLEASTIAWHLFDVFEDDQKEQNLVYPLWYAGIRLLTFQSGLDAEELLRFYLILTGVTFRPASIDLVTALWKEDFQHISWVVIDDFDLVSGEGADVELEVETVLSYLKNALSSEAGTGVSFARVSLADLDLKLENIDTIRSTELKGKVITAAEQSSFRDAVDHDDAYVLEKVCSILFRVMEIDADDEDIDDLRAAIEQVLDGLLLQGKFKVIVLVLETCAGFAVRPDLPVPNREFARRTEEDLLRMMQEPQRMRSITAALNSGISKDVDAVSAFLLRLGPSSVVMTLDLLNSLNNPSHRRAVSDVLVDIGRHGVQLFASRLKSASSQFAKELLYVIDAINPPNKLDLFKNVLEHDNGVLRMEGLSVIGRNKTDACFRIVNDVFQKHEVPQMRAHAARILAQYGERGGPVLLAAANASNFEARPKGEQRAILSSLVKVESAESKAFFVALFTEKSGMLKRKLEEQKRMAIAALETVPSIASMQLLAQVAKDTRLHGKDVCESAKHAALRIKAKMLGENG